MNLLIFNASAHRARQRVLSGVARFFMRAQTTASCQIGVSYLKWFRSAFVWHNCRKSSRLDFVAQQQPFFTWGSNAWVYHETTLSFEFGGSAAEGNHLVLSHAHFKRNWNGCNVQRKNTWNLNLKPVVLAVLFETVKMINLGKRSSIVAQLNHRRRAGDPKNDYHSKLSPQLQREPILSHQ